MDKLLMLGTSYASSEIVKYAKSLGVYTIVTDPNEPEHSIAKLASDEYWMLNTGELDALEKRCREEGVSAVACGISEFNLEMQMELCRRLDLPCYCTPEAWHFSRDKADFKKLCRELEAPIPEDYYISEEMTEAELDSVVFPVVVKPVDLSANRGIRYCHNREELVQACRYARSMSKSSKLVVERMLQGEEWYGYYALAEGEARLVALNAMYAQPGEPKNCYTITSTVSDNIKRYCEEIDPKIIEVLKRVGCREGIAWVQVMLDKDDHFYIIEMGYRLPGGMPFMQYPYLTSFDSVKWMTECALGVRHSAGDLPQRQTGAFEKCGCSFTLWTGNVEGTLGSLEGLEDAAGKDGVQVYCMSRPGTRFGPYQILGSIVITAENCAAMCETLDIVNQTIRILDTEGRDVLVRYTDFDYLKEIYRKGLSE